MTPKMLKIIAGLHKRHAIGAKAIKQAHPVVLSDQVMQAACELAVTNTQKGSKLTQANAIIQKHNCPAISSLPFRTVFVEADNRLFYARNGSELLIEVWLVEDGHAVFLGHYQPGKNGLRVQVPNLQDQPRKVHEDFLRMIIFLAVFVSAMSIMNIPGMTVKSREKGSVTHRRRVKSKLGMAASGWTTIDLIPGAKREIVEREKTESSQHVALHWRKATHYWLPHQKQTKTAVWIDRDFAGPRGPGWYRFSPPCVIGSVQSGVKVQRHVVHMTGEARPQIASLRNIETVNARQLQLQVLGDAQRALLVEAGEVPSGTLH